MNIFYENINHVNKPFYKEFMASLKKLNINGSYILGKNVKKFEENFSNYLGTNYCVGVANGLDALTISLKSLQLPSNSEILVASNSYIACIISIINAGLKPVLVEPRIDNYNIDPKEIRKKITNKTKGILAVHLYGKSCDMDEILSICNKEKLYLIEDCAQSHGSTYKNKKTGTFGKYGCFSFYPTKLLGAIGDGGAIVCKKKNEINYFRKYRNYGSVKRYRNEIIGENSRLDEIQSLFLRIKLKYLDKIIKYKRGLSEVYFENLNNKFVVPLVEKHKKDSFYIFNIRHESRDRLRKYLQENNIMTDIHYPLPPYKQSALKNYFEDRYPISDEIHKTTISLPISFAH